MTQDPQPRPAGTAATPPEDASNRFATLTFERDVAAPVSTLWQAWTAPAARALWAGPAPSACGWLDLRPGRLSVGYEVVSSQGTARSAALITARFTELGERSRMVATVQLSALAGETEEAYRQGFAAGLDDLAGVAGRTMVLQKVIRAPRAVVWNAWMNPETLPQWWGPQGFSCRTRRIDLRQGGEWVFDMIGPDGTVYPNHHLYGEVRPHERFGYALLWGENGPKHADAWAAFEDQDGSTLVTLGMVFSTAAEFHKARGFGAVELGLETLGKLARFVASR